MRTSALLVTTCSLVLLAVSAAGEDERMAIVGNDRSRWHISVRPGRAVTDGSAPLCAHSIARRRAYTVVGMLRGALLS